MRNQIKTQRAIREGEELFLRRTTHSQVHSHVADEVDMKPSYLKGRYEALEPEIRAL